MLGAHVLVPELCRFRHGLVEQPVETAAQIHLACARASDTGLLFQISVQFPFYFLRGCPQLRQNGGNDGVWLL